MNRSIAIFAILGAVIASVAFAAFEPVAYPEDYRNWTHVKSMLIGEGHPLYDSFGGVHHIYANDAALQGYRRGEFPDGAVIVFDLLESRHEDNAVVEGERKVLGVMQRDKENYSDTGGWGFEGFAGGDPEKRVVGENAKEACFACHQAKADADFVFSKWRK